MSILPATDPLDPPYAEVRINEAWLPYLLGAVVMRVRLDADYDLDNVDPEDFINLNNLVTAVLISTPCP